ncbi:hypothetical protein F1C14_08385 [Clostridium perfringens]|nr:hypothetical protein F1C14_08385 [Clostridium perfringens]
MMSFFEIKYVFNLKNTFGDIDSKKNIFLMKWYEFMKSYSIAEIKKKIYKWLCFLLIKDESIFIDGTKVI